MVILSKKTFFVLTGGSRGIGKEMAIQLASKLGEGSVMILLARSMTGLEETKKAIQSRVPDGKIQIITFSIDLSKATKEIFQDVLKKSFQLSNKIPEDFERGFIIHNAGSVGDVSQKAQEFGNINVWQSYYHLNMFSVVALNTAFVDAMKGISKLVVNLSSKCALVPFSSMSMYCTGKAARDMYFRCLAVEEEDILVLNYAPGVIDTDMTVLVQNESCDPIITEYFRNQRDSKIMLTTSKTTQKFIQILEEEKFQSGDHVDYWD